MESDPVTSYRYSTEANAGIYLVDNCFLLTGLSRQSVSSMEGFTMSDDTRSGSGFSWFLAGLGLGSLLGVLYAPRAGEETREELLATAMGSAEYARQRSREATRAANDYVERGKGQVGDYVSKGKDQVNEYVSKGKDAVEVGRQKVNEVYNQGRQVVAEQKEKLNASYNAGKQAYAETTVEPLPEDELIPKGEHLG